MPNLFCFMFVLHSPSPLTAVCCHILFPQFLTRCLISRNTTLATIISYFRLRHHCAVLPQLPQCQHFKHFICVSYHVAI
uniref:Putative secreted peptide n=1 Tax=Anopheles braziliensis TaxID=58242 RepID=A0A2M3ZQK7_9DIPT